MEYVVLQRGGELAFDLVEAGVTVLLRRRQDLLELGDDLAVARRHRGDLARGDFKDLLGDQRGGRALRRVLETRHRLGLLQFETRSEERRVGKACVRKCRSGWSPYH